MSLGEPTLREVCVTEKKYFGKLFSFPPVYGRVFAFIKTSVATATFLFGIWMTGLTVIKESCHIPRVPGMTSLYNKMGSWFFVKWIYPFWGDAQATYTFVGSLYYPLLVVGAMALSFTTHFQLLDYFNPARSKWKNGIFLVCLWFVWMYMFHLLIFNNITNLIHGRALHAYD